MNALFKLMLRSSAIGALSLAAVAVGCSDSDSNGPNPGAGGDDTGGTSTAGTKGSQAGEPGAGGDGEPGGTSGGGTSGNGGSNLGGDNVGGETVGGNGSGGDGNVIIPVEGGSPAFGGGGDNGTGTGPSVAKFCNTLSFGQADTTMILEIGEGAEKVTFTAATGECAPPDGQECKEIPQGDNVPVTLFDADNTSTPLDEKVAPVGAGEDWVFWTELDGPSNDPFPIVTGSTIDQSVVRCQEVVYDDLP